MNFKILYATFAFALVVAACGEKPDSPSSDVASNPALASQAAAVGALETIGAMQGGAARTEMKQFAQAVGRIGDAIATVKDEESARAAAATISQINREIEPLTRVMEGWSENEKRAAAMAAAGDMVQAQQKMGIAAANLAMTRPELMEIIGQELDRIPTIE